MHMKHMDTYEDVATLAAETNPANVAIKQTAVTHHTTETKQNSILLYARVLHSIRGHLLAALARNEGFVFALTVHNTTHDVHEYVSTERAWVMYENGFPLHAPHPTQFLTLLPTRLLKQTSRSTRAQHGARAAARLQAIVQRLETVCARTPVRVGSRCAAGGEILETLSAHPLIAEEKFDGDRMQFHYKRTPGSEGSGEFRFFTRGSFDWSQRYTSLANDVMRLMRACTAFTISTAILDGELTVFDAQQNTHSPWGAQHVVAQYEQARRTLGGPVMLHDVRDADDTHAQEDIPRYMDTSSDPLPLPTSSTYLQLPRANLCYVVFDIVHLNGENLAHMPLYTRRAILEKCIGNGLPTRVICPPQTPVPRVRDVLKLLNEIQAKAGEGVVVKNPYSPYVPGRHVHWAKLKLLADRIDTCIVGFGFQLVKDLASTGNPHIASFTVAVRDDRSTQHAKLVTICEVPFFKGSRDTTNECKEQYVRHGTVCSTRKILSRLGEATAAEFTLIDEFPAEKCRLSGRRAQASGTRRREIVLKWDMLESAASAAEQSVRDATKTIVVHYDAEMTNIQAVAHPELVGLQLAVSGDYRLQHTLSEPRRFTAACTVRFPRGVFRTDKPLVRDADTLQTLLRTRDSGSLAGLAVRNVRDEAVMPPAISPTQHAKDAQEMRDRAIRVLGAPSAASLEDIARLERALKSISDKWPTKLSRRSPISPPNPFFGMQAPASPALPSILRHHSARDNSASNIDALSDSDDSSAAAASARPGALSPEAETIRFRLQHEPSHTRHEEGSHHRRSRRSRHSAGTALALARVPTRAQTVTKLLARLGQRMATLAHLIRTNDKQLERGFASVLTTLPVMPQPNAPPPVAHP
jgi:hypothetical protein